MRASSIHRQPGNRNAQGSVHRYNGIVQQAIAPDTLRRVRRVQAITIAWMSAEAAVSLFAAWRARSPALLAFGGDSAIELASAVIVFRRFRTNSPSEHAERHAAQIAGVLLFALAIVVLGASVMGLFGYNEPKPSFLGIAILIAAATLMPLLARVKRQLSAETGSSALRADAAESALCGYLSLIALLGLVVNTIWHIAWADSVAALLIIPLVVREGREAMRGKPCECS